MVAAKAKARHVAEDGTDSSVGWHTAHAGILTEGMRNNGAEQPSIVVHLKSILDLPAEMLVAWDRHIAEYGRPPAPDMTEPEEWVRLDLEHRFGARWTELWYPMSGIMAVWFEGRWYEWVDHDGDQYPHSLLRRILPDHPALPVEPRP